MREVVIIDAVRSPIGKRNGALAMVHPTDVLGPVLQALLKRHGPAVILGGSGRGWLHQQSWRTGHERDPNGVAVARRVRGCGVFDRRFAVRLLAVRREPGRVDDPRRRRGHRGGVRCREPEPGTDRGRCRGGRRRRLREAAVPLVLRAIRVGDAVRGCRADRREVRHHPSDVRRVRVGIAGACRPGRRRGPLRATDRSARRRDTRRGRGSDGRDAAIRTRRDPP